ncbi:MAG: hypothetical protein Kow002_01630 [Anaerolineales bacterium]
MARFLYARSMSKSVVLAYALRIRKGPGTNFSTLGYLRQNDEVDVLGTNADGSWSQIKTQSGQEGWASSVYLKALEPPPTPPDGGSQEPPEGSGAQYRVTANALYVRSGPGSQYPATTYLKRDEVVEGLEAPAGDWVKIRRDNGLIGWSHTKYLLQISAPVEPPENPNTGQEPVFRVTAYALYLRTGPGTNYKISGYLRQGDIVHGIGFSPDRKWVHVRKADGKTAWCAGRYLLQISEPPPPEKQTDDLEKTGLHRVTLQTLKLHPAPDESEAAIANLEFEQIVDVLSISADKLWKEVVTAHGQIGWCNTYYLDHIGELGQVQENEEFPWMPIAFNELGVREFPGAPNNPRVMEYLYSTTLRDLPYTFPDETDWCAAFVNWCVEQSGQQGNKSALVDHWQNWGKPLNTPRRGCVVTFRWDDGGTHVSFYLGEKDGRTYALGGNQSDAVWIKSYPTQNVTGYRVPEGWLP